MEINKFSCSTEKEQIKTFLTAMQPAIQAGRLSNSAIEELVKLGFFKAPASIHHHGAYPGALFDHSLAVMNALIFLTDRLELKWETPESPYIVGMFHDLCKVDNYRKTEQSITEAEFVGGGKRTIREEAWEYNNATLLPGHGEKSVILCQKLFPLTDEEIYCIRWHMGAFDDKANWNSYGRSVTEFPNVLYTHTADMIAARIKGV